MIFYSNYTFGKSTDPTFFFKVAEAVISIFYGAMYYVVWMKQDLIRSIFTQVQLRKNLLKRMHLDLEEKPAIKYIGVRKVCLYVSKVRNKSISLKGFILR